MKKLMRDYFTRTPSFGRVAHKHFQKWPVPIDHIAHRTLQKEPLVHFYQQQGFLIQKETYHFPKLNTLAVWLKPETNPNFRVFISESHDIKNFGTGRLRSPAEYTALMKSNQYLAWVLMHGDVVNHVAVGVRDIETFYRSIQSDPEFSIGSPLKISKDGKLKQFSLQADPLMYEFPNGERDLIAGSFVEFIERIGGRDGFDVDNAETIFSSTAKVQKNRHHQKV